MSERHLRRKLTFHAHGKTLVLVKRPDEKLEHRVMMALLWALYLPRYPDIRIDVPIGTRYRPDLIQLDPLDPAGQPLFWGEAGEVGIEKLRTLCSRYRNTHLVFAKWGISLHPFANLIESALRSVRRDAPIELLGFSADAHRFVSDTGEITIQSGDVERRVWGEQAQDTQAKRSPRHR